MPYYSLNISVDTTDAEKEIRAVQQGLADLRPLWEVIYKEFLKVQIAYIFASDGRGLWAPTQRDNPILRDTKRLYKSYLVPGADGNINIRTADSFEWGSDVEYAHFHEFPSEDSALPARKVIGLLEETPLEEIVDSFFQMLIDGFTE